jgi:hypothetical protein
MRFARFGVVVIGALTLAGCASQSVAGLGTPAGVLAAPASRSTTSADPSVSDPGAPAPSASSASAAKYLLTQQDVPSGYQQRDLQPFAPGGREPGQVVTPPECRSPSASPAAASRPSVAFIDATSGTSISSTIIDAADGGPYASVSIFRRTILGACAVKKITGESGGKPYVLTQVATELPVDAPGVSDAIAVTRTTTTQIGTDAPTQDTSSIALLAIPGGTVQLAMGRTPSDAALLQRLVTTTAAKIR